MRKVGREITEGEGMEKVGREMGRRDG